MATVISCAYHATVGHHLCTIGMPMLYNIGIPMVHKWCPATVPNNVDRIYMSQKRKNLTSSLLVVSRFEVRTLHILYIVLTN